MLFHYKKFTEPFIELFNDLCGESAITKKIGIKYIMDEEFYMVKKKEEEVINDKTDKSFTYNTYEKKLKTINNQKSSLISFDRVVEYNTLLDELLFWCVEHLFPLSLCRLLENLLTEIIPDEKKYLKFVKTFSYEYWHISLISSQSEEQLHQQIGCQLFNNPKIAKKAVDSCQIFQILLASFFNFFKNSKILKRIRRSFYLDFQNITLRKGIHFTNIIDMSYLLNHEDNLNMFLKTEIFSTWLKLVSYYQNVNLYKRQFGVHVEYESLISFSAFLSEWEFCSVIVWSIVQHLKDGDQKYFNLINNALKMNRNALEVWFRSTTKTKHIISRVDSNCLSFHIPLSRHYSILLYNSIYKLNNGYFIDDKVFLLNLLTHPLHIHSCYHEILANIWVRNGLQMKECAIYYTRNDFCRSFIDADLFLIQICAANLDR